MHCHYLILHRFEKGEGEEEIEKKYCRITVGSNSKREWESGISQSDIFNLIKFSRSEFGIFIL